MTDQIEAFEKADVYRLETVPLVRIVPPDLVGAKSKTKKSIQQLGYFGDTIKLREVQGADPEDPEAKLYQIIDGRRRIQDLIDIHGPDAMFEVPAAIFGPNVPKRTIFAVMMASNMSRGSNPVDEAKAIDALCKDGMDYHQIASLFGYSPKKVEMLRKLLLLPSETRSQVEQGKITPSVALSITKLSEQDRKAIETLAKRGEKIVASTIKDLRSATLRDSILDAGGFDFGTTTNNSLEYARLDFLEASKRAMRSGLTTRELRDLLTEARGSL
jgi:ParB-like chromosome segregation protein Spo0J